MTTISFAEDSDQNLPAVEKLSQQVMTTVKSIASAVEGGGADAGAAFGNRIGCRSGKRKRTRLRLAVGLLR